MAGKVLNKETKAISGKELQIISLTIGSSSVVDVEFARCDCCGLTEECTLGYIARIRERHQGRWICGLCSEAVKYEVCEEFKSSSPLINTGGEDLMIATMKQNLRRTLDSLRRGGEGFGCGLRPLSRSKSCFATSRPSNSGQAQQAGPRPVRVARGPDQPDP
ncbi:hypothetical protein PanWU01x14_011490, partial [Parasponia andersonii]